MKYLLETLRVLKQIMKAFSRFLKKNQTERNKNLMNNQILHGRIRKQRICCTKDKSNRTRTKNINTNQMLSRLPIFLAQLKAGNNSQKLKNEIRQLLYSLYRSKKVTKTIYNHLINAI